MRAARYDGVVPHNAGMERGEVFTLEDLEAMRALINREGDFDYVMSGSTASPDDTDAVRAWRAAGATWWLEAIYPFGGAAARMRDRVRAGPPSI